MILLAAAMAATLPGKAQTDTIQYRTFQGYLNPHERGTIHIPDILGYRTIKADLHLHTHQSDGGVAPYFRVWEAYQEGLDAIALTDHQPMPRYNKNPDGNISHLQAVLTSSSCHPKIFVKEFSYFLMSCHQHCLGVNLLVQR